jgi:O-antigen/teichoic acid export membrane protein
VTPPPGSVSRRFLALGSGEVVARLVAFGVTVYVARTLGAQYYGVLASATAVVMYLAFVADAGLEWVGVRQVAAEPDRVPTLLAGILGSRLCIAAGLITATAVLATLSLPAPDGMALTLYAGTLVATALGTRFVHVGLDRAGSVAWSRVLGEAAVAVLAITFVHRSEHLLRVPIAQVIGDVLAALLLLRLLPAGRRPARLRVRVGATLALMRESAPMVLHGLLGLTIFNSDFLFLRVFNGAASVGFYAVAYTLISFVQNLGSSYTVSLIPTLTVVRGDRGQSQRIVDAGMLHALFGALPITVGGLIVASSLVSLFFGPGYAPSARPLQILLLLIPIALVRNVWQAVLVAFGRQDLMLRTVAWAAGANVLLNLALIPVFGMIGAAVATVATEVARTWLSAHYAAGLSMAMPSISRFWRLLLATAGMALVTWLSSGLPVVITIAVGGAGYAAVLLATGAVRLRRGRLPELSL